MRASAGLMLILIFMVILFAQAAGLSIVELIEEAVNGKGMT